MMRSELVVIHEPRVVRSYQDIIERNGLRLTFLNGSDETHFFRDAKEGTIEHLIWKKKLLINEVSVSVFGSLISEAVDQRLVSLQRDWILATGINMGLTKLLELGYDNIRVMLTNDETGKSFTTAFMIKKSAHKILKDFFTQR